MTINVHTAPINDVAEFAARNCGSTDRTRKSVIRVGVRFILGRVADQPGVTCGRRNGSRAGTTTSSTSVKRSPTRTPVTTRTCLAVSGSRCPQRSNSSSSTASSGQAFT